MRRPKLLDLFSCAGGAAMGYHRAGFDVTGVDIDPQPRYPFEHHVSDALEFLAEHGHKYDAIHASPPCQSYLNLGAVNRKLGRAYDHADLIEAPAICSSDPASPTRSRTSRMPSRSCSTRFASVAPAWVGHCVGTAYSSPTPT